jgi:hypothetical protein
MPFELKQLRQVVALAEHGSFVRAAAALHMSKPGTCCAWPMNSTARLSATATCGPDE